MTQPLKAPKTDPTPIFELFRGSYASDLLTAAVTHFDLFGRLAKQPRTLTELQSDLGIAERPSIVLTTALQAMQLLFKNDAGQLDLTDIAREHLVRGGDFDVGNYLSLAAAAHQGWSANIFTTASDMFPRRAVGSVVGLGGMAGAMGGATMAVATGYILDRTGGNYMVMFIVAGSAYLLALVIIHALAPSLAPINEEDVAAVRAFSVGSLVGFGFVGFVLGTFGGWVTGLLLRVAGQKLLAYMTAGAGIGALVGAGCGVLICTVLAMRAKRHA